MAKLPKMGDKIPAAKFHVSKCNVRYGQPFGKSEKDKILVHQVRTSRNKRLVQVFKARLEGNGYGVFTGRRRFLAKKEVGAKTFTVGVDVIVEDVTEEEAREDSLIENLKTLKEDMNAIARAKQLNELLIIRPDGIRGTARRLGISPATLSEWLKVLELSPKMQDAVAKGSLYFTDALRLARMKIGNKKQDELANTLETEGLDAFQKNLQRLSDKTLKRGIPPGKYEIVRTTFDKYYKQDMALLQEIDRRAEAKHMKRDEWVKWFLSENVKAA